MNPRTFVSGVLAWLLLTAAAVAQTSTDLNEGAIFSVTPTAGVFTLAWWGRAGRTYFIQESDDLVHWTYVPMIEVGADAVLQWGFASSAPKLFMRLEYMDILTTDPFNDDFDGDGVSNLNELLQNTDPLVATLDTNGLPLDWEKFYGIPAGTDANAPAPRGDGRTYLEAFQEGLNPVDFYNGHVPAVMVVSGDGQTGAPGGLVSLPLVVSVTESGDHAPFAFASVTFSVTPSGGQLQTSDLGTPGTQVTAVTDDAGQAKAFFQLPSGAAGQTYQVTAAVTTRSGQVVSQTFTESADDGGTEHVSPFAPSNIVAQLQPDGSVDVTWTNHSDDPGDISLSIQLPDSSWSDPILVPAGTTSAQIPAR